MTTCAHDATLHALAILDRLRRLHAAGVLDESDIVGALVEVAPIQSLMQDALGNRLMAVLERWLAEVQRDAAFKCSAAHAFDTAQRAIERARRAEGAR